MKLKINCEYTGMIDINQLIENPLNKELYGDITTDEDYLDSLADLIENQGLHECIDLYEGTTEMDSGHHRTLSLKRRGFKEIPFKYVKKPKTELERMERIISKNTRKPLTPTQKFEAIKKLRDKRLEDGLDHDIDKQTRGYCASLSTTWDTYDKLSKIYLERQDIYDKIAAGELGVTPGYNQYLEDKKGNTSLAAAPSLTNMIKEDQINKTMLSLTDYLHKIYNTESNVNGVKYKFTPDFQLNVLGGFFHECFCKTIATVLTEDLGEKCIAPNDQGNFDLQMPNKAWEPEVKTAKWKGTNTKSIKWVTNKLKNGYYFLLACDPGLNRFYVAYGFIESSSWKPSGKVKTLDLKSASKCNLKEFIGEIKDDTLFLDKVK
tara:strand:+ start:413 stop:1543 length:1131 start_codon:yes stop_codon:yes gene_type:complete